MQYTTFEKVGGDLRISLTDIGHLELDDQRADQERQNRGTWVRSDVDIFYDLIEWHLCNGWDLITAEEIGALTSNPYMLTDSARHDSEGELTSVGTVYAFDAYQVRDPLEDLESGGSVVFRGYSE